MKIRKKFKFEAAHIVRDCSSTRCKFNIHGHSFIVEIFFKSRGLDKGFMVYDFGLLKGNISTLIDSFDHAYLVWDREDPSLKQQLEIFSERIVTLPLSPSAESLSLTILYLTDLILEKTAFLNKEHLVEVDSVRVHETETGYAEASREDLEFLVDHNGKLLSDYLNEVSLKKMFSPCIKKEWDSNLLILNDLF